MRLDLDELDEETLTRLSDKLVLSERRVAVLSEFKEGQVVSVKGTDSNGVVVSLMEDDFDFPVGTKENGDPKVEEIEASSDDPVYIVAMETGGNVAVSEDQLSSGSFDSEKGEDDVKELANKAEEAAVYEYMDNPHGSMEELHAAWEQYCREHEELVNVRGVDDPEVGFSTLPKGWTRKSVLQAWASLGGTWTTCNARMTGRIRNPKRFCAALKDEVLQTEMWRNKF